MFVLFSILNFSTGRDKIFTRRVLSTPRKDFKVETITKNCFIIN